MPMVPIPITTTFRSAFSSVNWARVRTSSASCTIAATFTMFRAGVSRVVRNTIEFIEDGVRLKS